MKEIVRWGLWQRRWFIMWWLIGIASLIILNLAFYPSFRDQARVIEESLGQIPDAAMTLLSDTSDLMSPEGYLSSQIFYLTLPLLLSILAIGLGASLIGREEKEGTIELLLSRPISRSSLLTAKALTGLLIILAAGLSASILAVAMARIVNLEVASGSILMAGLASTLLGLSFGAVAFLISALGRTGRAVSIGIAALYALGGYIIVSFKNNAEWLKWPSRLFPYNYYHPGEILSGTHNWSQLLVIIGIIIGCLLLSIIAFHRRDIG